MGRQIILNNTTSKYFKLNYRIPGDPLKILEVEVIACALNQKVNFPSDECYDEFMKQNGHYFKGDTPILVEGKTTVRKLEKLNEKGDKEARQIINKELQEIDITVDSIAREKTGKGVQMKVKKGTGQTWE